MNFEIPDGARYILQTLNIAGHEAYLVGGCVRDLLRGVGPHDWDICTSALPEETELLRRHQEIYLSQFGRERYDRYIQIPLAPGEAPRPVSDWTEE